MSQGVQFTWKISYLFHKVHNFRTMLLYYQVCLYVILMLVSRTRPIFQIHTNMTASSLSVSFTEPNCVLSGAQNASADGIWYVVYTLYSD